LSTPRAEELIRLRLTEAIESLQALPDSECVTLAAKAAAEMVSSLENSGKIMFCGNGGSSMDAGHLAAELVGRFYKDRPPLPAVSLADATAVVTAVSNDYSYADVFARQVAAIGQPGDVLVCLTTSGNSPNVVQAVNTAKDLSIATIALTGAAGGKVSEIADMCIKVATTDTPRVQEACLHLAHSICELVEGAMFPPVD
jgi:D-sedoheptulose 7-phosphate isomerase